MSGVGTQALSNTANTYTGTTTVSGGVLVVSADGNLGTAPAAATIGDLVLNGGTLLATNTFPLSSNRGIALGPTSGSGTGTIDVTGTNVLTYGGIMANNGTGTGSLTKIDAGTLILAGVNTYSGGATITAGTLQLGNTSALTSATSVTDNGTLDLGGFSNSIGALTGTGSAHRQRRRGDLDRHRRRQLQRQHHRLEHGPNGRRYHADFDFERQQYLRRPDHDQQRRHGPGR